MSEYPLNPINPEEVIKQLEGTDYLAAPPWYTPEKHAKVMKEASRLIANYTAIFIVETKWVEVDPNLRTTKQEN